jgi:hypothetical protein
MIKCRPAQVDDGPSATKHYTSEVRLDLQLAAMSDTPVSLLVGSNISLSHQDTAAIAPPNVATECESARIERTSS